MLNHLAIGFGAALDPINLLYCLLGVLIGTLIGVLPGLGPIATIAILLPTTYTMDPTGAVIMLAGIYYGAQYGGSTTAILVNMPGEASSAVTTLDGHAMARQGRAGSALAIAAIGSFTAGSIAMVLVALLGAPMARIGLMFGPADYCALMVLGLVLAIVLARGDIIKAFAAVAGGLVLATIGSDVETGQYRMNFGLSQIAEGLELTAVAMGIFGIADMLTNLEAKSDRSILQQKIHSLWPSRREFRQAAPAIGRGTIIGSILGILPGGGAALAAFAAYSVEKRMSSTPERFGTGMVQGVAAPESANNAAAQTSFIPLLTLGIPPNAVMALIVGAMVVQGIVPGPEVMTRQPELFWGLIASMWIGNLFLLVINLPLIGLWVGLLKVPYRLLFPAIVLVCCIGVYSVGHSSTMVILTAIFGFVGYLMIKGGFEATPFLLAFIVGPLLEENLRRAMLISRGSPAVFIERPISATLLVVAAVLVVIAVLPSVRRRREQVFESEAS